MPCPGEIPAGLELSSSLPSRDSSRLLGGTIRAQHLPVAPEPLRSRSSDPQLGLQSQPDCKGDFLSSVPVIFMALWSCFSSPALISALPELSCRSRASSRLPRHSGGFGHSSAIPCTHPCSALRASVPQSAGQLCHSSLCTFFFTRVRWNKLESLLHAAWK